jgi:hypothetical protein
MAFRRSFALAFLAVAGLGGMAPPLQQPGSGSSKVFTWRQLLSGDCVMLPGSKLVLHADGTGDFNATTYTNRTQSGDKWHHVISVTDDQDQRVFLLGPYDGPPMNGGNPPPLYSWHVTVHFPQADFTRAAHALTAFYSC